jgi:hypothetical protein
MRLPNGPAPHVNAADPVADAVESATAPVGAKRFKLLDCPVAA